jgi:hypothetical protein
MMSNNEILPKFGKSGNKNREQAESFKPDVIDKYRGVNMSSDGKDSLPWERLTDPLSKYINDPDRVIESSSEHFLFAVYLMQPPTSRTLVETAKIVKEQTGRNISMSQLSRLKDKFSWEDRVAAYDDSIMSLRMDEHNLDVLQMNKYYATLSRKLVDTYMMLHEAVTRKMANGVDMIEELSKLPSRQLLRELSKYTWHIEQMMKMERIARGLSTENVAVKKEISEKVDVNVQIKDLRAKLEDAEKKIEQGDEIV